MPRRRVLLCIATVLLAGAARGQQRNLPVLDAKQRAVIVKRLSEVLTENYVLADAATRMANHLDKQLEAKKYAGITDLRAFAARLTTDLRSAHRDLHLKVTLLRRQTDIGRSTSSLFKVGNDPEAERRVQEEWEHRNFGFHRVERLKGNIGYIDLRLFAHPRRGGETARAAMRFLAHCDALIIDLRKNDGGHTAMIQLLCSYLFDKPMLLDTYYTRKDDKTKQVWTHHVDGPLLVKTPVYVLTSRAVTFSAAEALAYDLKVLGRATIVGERTSGGSNSIEYIDLPDLSLTVKVPITRSINPVTGGDFEGTGVQPDIEVPAAQALDAACVKAIEGALASESEIDRKVALRDIFLPHYRGRVAPTKLDRDATAGYVGEYASRRRRFTVRQTDAGLTVESPGLGTMAPEPLSRDRFRLQEGVHLWFRRDEAGKVNGAVITVLRGREGFRDFFDRKTT